MGPIGRQRLAKNWQLWNSFLWYYERWSSRVALLRPCLHSIKTSDILILTMSGRSRKISKIPKIQSLLIWHRHLLRQKKHWFHTTLIQRFDKISKLTDLTFYVILLSANLRSPFLGVQWIVYCFLWWLRSECRPTTLLGSELNVGHYRRWGFNPGNPTRTAREAT